PARPRRRRTALRGGRHRRAHRAPARSPLPAAVPVGPPRPVVVLDGVLGRARRPRRPRERDQRRRGVALPAAARDLPAVTRRLATRETLQRDLEAMGIARGDAVLVRANVGAIGRVRGGLGESLRGALLDAVGEAGTIVSLAFTRTFPLFRLDRSYVFDE